MSSIFLPHGATWSVKATETVQTIEIVLPVPKTNWSIRAMEGGVLLEIGQPSSPVVAEEKTTPAGKVFSGATVHAKLPGYTSWRVSLDMFHQYGKINSYRTLSVGSDCIEYLINFDDARDAAVAVKELHGRTIDDYVITVKMW